MAKEDKAKEDKGKDTAQGDESPKSKKKGGGKLKIIIVAVVVLALAGGALFYLEFMTGGEHATAQKKEEHKAPIFVTLEPFTVNLQPEGSERYLQIGVDFKVADQKVVDDVKLHMPEIRNGILLLLSSKQAADVAGMEGKQKLSAEILAQANKPLSIKPPARGVTGVFFTSFVIQ